MVSSAKRYLRLILFYQGIVTMGMGLTWVLDFTSGRFRGVVWLDELLNFVPYLDVDDKVGALWLLSGVIMTLSGTRLSRTRGWLENAGFVMGIAMPLFMGSLFVASFFMGINSNGYISAISYLMFATPYLAYLRIKPQELSDETGTIDILGKE